MNTSINCIFDFSKMSQEITFMDHLLLKTWKIISFAFPTNSNHTSEALKDIKCLIISVFLLN